MFTVQIVNKRFMSFEQNKNVLDKDMLNLNIVSILPMVY